MSTLETILESLPENLAPQVSTQVPLRSLTTLKIGGPAALVCAITTPEQAKGFHAWIRKNGLESYILGAGSNVLAADHGFSGAILRVATDSFTVRGNRVTVGAGADFDAVVAKTLAAGLTGLEFASGLPGTLGGAIMGNAGCYGHEIGEFVRRALLLTPDGELAEISAEDFGFSYRVTALRESGAILLEATLELAAGDREVAEATRRERLADRRAKHPVDLPCAGSWFRNLPAAEPGGRRRPAGALLEQAGAKAMREGDAQVFARHANIIVNAGQATSHDVSRLARRMQQAVHDRFGVDLVAEVRSIPGGQGLDLG